MPTAPPATSTDLVALVRLADETVVQLRPISPDDLIALHQFHAGLSPQSRYYRFFNHHPQLSDKEARRFVSVDQADRVAIVATIANRLVAVARFEREPDTDSAEAAFVVDDVYQGQGLGKALLAQLIRAARHRGITRLVANVLPDNYAMQTVLRGSGYPLTAEFSGGVLELSIDLTNG
jgi:RimJ/RimL family protein N-acetyltransferase